MINTEVLIIGGGPAGSACARRLKKLGIDCAVVDQHAFPRFKPCAGWVTPEVLRDLNITPDDYPPGMMTFTSFDVSIKGFSFRMPTHQHAIRRIEFDDWLLNRAGVPVYRHTVKNISKDNGAYVVDGEFCARYLVGAGGTHCPVFRTFFQSDRPKAKSSLIVAQEDEFPYPYTDGRCRLWFVENGLPGYAWYVPKANGYLNVGVGGKAEVLKANGDSLKRHWNLLVEKLDRMGLVRDYRYKPSGHSYYLNQSRQPNLETRRDNVLLAGDALGLATQDMGEGIGPAIRSGVLAAEAIVNNNEYSVGTISRYSLRSLIRLGRAPRPARR